LLACKCDLYRYTEEELRVRDAGLVGKAAAASYYLEVRAVEQEESS
jgi:hypothetical protein